MNSANTQNLDDDTPGDESSGDLAWLMAYTDDNAADYSDGCSSCGGCGGCGGD